MNKSLVVFIGLAVLAPLAWAQTAVEVVPAENVDRVLDSVPALISAAVLAIVARFAGPLAALIKIMRLDQLLVRSIKAEWDKFVDEKQLKGKSLTIDLKNEFIANTVRAVMEWGPKALINWAGGEAGIRQKIRARLPDFLKEVADVAV